MARAKKPTKPKSKKPAKPIARKPAPKVRPKSLKTKRQLAAAERTRQKNHASALKRDAESKAQARQRRINEKGRRTKLKKAKAKARQAATRAQKGGKKSPRFQLEDALEHMRATSPHALSLQVEYAPVMGKGSQPWLLMGRFAPSADLTFPLSWGDVGEICQHWEQDDILAVTIGLQRFAFVRFLYQRYDDDGEPVGAPEGYAAAGAGAWEFVISETVAAINSGDTDDPLPESLAVMYPNSQILEIQVLWSASDA